ncbi:MAG: flagellar biosynthetic protein FliO [Desulfobacterales bacterium]
MTYDPDFLSAALKMGAALAVVLATVWGLSRLLKGPLAQGRGQGGALLRIRASLPVGVKKQVTLVEVPGAVLVLGVAPDRITCLERIADKELIERIRAQGQGAGRPDFKALLRRAGGKSLATGFTSLFDGDVPQAPHSS